MRHLPVIALLTLACACSGGVGTTPLPRREAYPRAPRVDTLYNRATGIPVDMLVNTSADTTLSIQDSGIIWLTVSYPEYRASVHYTFMPIDNGNMEEAVENRMQRMELNIGGAEAESVYMETESGYTAGFVCAPGAVTTPVMFLAFNPVNPRWLVSGSAYFHSLPVNASVDSLAPMVDFIQQDMMRSVESLADR